MFEDSTFESTGRIRTRSRGWMVATFLFNGSILLTLILIPLIYPEALPRQMMGILLEAPPPPPQLPPVVKEVPTRETRDYSEIEDGHIFAPPRIPTTIRMLSKMEPPPGNVIPGLEPGQNGTEVPGALFGSGAHSAVVRQEPKGPIRLPSTIVAGLIVQKTIPVYPLIAKAARIEGTVILQATISATGTIENLRVVSGHPMLQQAAMDAVRNWRYRPYLLNGQPVEVETTVNVIFTLSH